MLYVAVVTLAHVYNYTHGACYSSQLELEVMYIWYVVHAILIMGNSNLREFLVPNEET